MTGRPGAATSSAEPSPPAPGTGARLEVNSPLSAAARERLALAATAHRPRSIIDHGCGWGTMLLRALAAAPQAHGLGIDVHAPDISRARAAAADAGLSDRCRFEVGESTGQGDRADLLLSIGAFHAFGDLPDALSALAQRLEPGGRVLFGVEISRARPTDAELAHMWDGATEQDCLTLADLVDLVHQEGFRVLDLHESTPEEFDAFELGHLRGREEWLLEHPGHPVRDQLDAAWTSWLRGHRRPMGFVTLLLGHAPLP